MKITNLQITSATTLNLDSTFSAPICVLRGRYSDLALDLMRELLSDYGAQNDPDRVDDGRFVIHADIEMDNKNFDVCYIRNADFMGDNRIAANFEPNRIGFSEDDTREFVEKCNERDVNNHNVLIKTADIPSCTDDRPIFIYDYFDRLASLGRQVFIAVCPKYPIQKMKHDKVQVVNTEADNVEA